MAHGLPQTIIPIQLTLLAVKVLVMLQHTNPLSLNWSWYWETFIYNLFQRPWDFWPKFRSICWMKWETRFSRLNLIIRSIFPVGKKGQLGKKILFYVLQVYDFPFFQLSTKISYKPYLILRHQLLCLPIWLRESNKSDRNRTGDSMGHLASLNTIPSTWTSFIFIQIVLCGLG